MQPPRGRSLLYLRSKRWLRRRVLREEGLRRDPELLHRTMGAMRMATAEVGIPWEAMAVVR